MKNPPSTSTISPKLSFLKFPSSIPLIMFMTFIYFVAARLSLLLAFENTNASPVWPPSGIALAMIWIFGYRIWPGIFLGAFLANMTAFWAHHFASPLEIIVVSSLIGIGNTMEAVLGRFLLKRFIRDDNPLYKVEDVLKFFLAAVVICFVNAFIGPTVLCLSGRVPWQNYQTVWFTWWLGDLAGILTVSPLFFVFQRFYRSEWKIHYLAEAFFVFAVMVTVNVGIFGGNFFNNKFSFLCAYLLLPVVVWSAYRFGLPGAAVAVLMTLGIAIAGTINGLGPFANENLNIALLCLLAFIGTISMAGLILAAALKERQRIEEKLRQNERRFRSLVENSSDMVALIDPESTIIYASSSTTRILGYEINEYIGRKALDFVHPEDRANIAQTIGRIASQPQIVLYAACRYLHKDGSWRWLEGTGTNLLHDPAIQAIVANYRDITEKKKAEEDQLYFAAIVENSEDAIYGKSLDGVITSWNKGAEKIYGYTYSEIIGKSVDLLVPANLRSESNEILSQLKRDKPIRPLETMRRRKDGQLIHVSMRISAIKDHDGKLIGASTIARDITERKQVELALKESESRFRNMADTAPVMIWMAGPDAVGNFFNKAWLDFTGQTMEHEISKGWIQSVHPDDKGRCFDIYVNALKNREKFTLDYRLRRRDGQYRWVLNIGVPRFTGTNQFDGYIGSCIDITERKMAEEILRRDAKVLSELVEKRSSELMKTQAELKHASRLADIGTLAATVAHELRNPLGVIQMAAFNLKRKHQDLAENKHLANIEKKIWEGNQIINNLLSYSRIQIPRYESVAISKILDECLQATQNRFHEDHIIFESKYDSEHLPAAMEADPLQIKEVLNNVLMNACQAFPSREGIVELIAESQDEEFVKIVVKDNGIGIDKEDLQKIFTPFFTKKSKGTGLGLTICNELVSLHNGKMEITSEKGRGTSIVIILPVKRENSYEKKDSYN